MPKGGGVQIYPTVQEWEGGPTTRAMGPTAKPHGRDETSIGAASARIIIQVPKMVRPYKNT